MNGSQEVIRHFPQDYAVLQVLATDTANILE